MTTMMPDYCGYSSPLLHGYLMRRTVRNTWTRYWCVIQGGCLYCYLTPDDHVSVDVTELDGYSVTSHEDTFLEQRFVLYLEHRDYIPVYLSASCGKEMEEWKASLITALKVISQTNDQANRNQADGALCRPGRGGDRTLVVKQKLLAEVLRQTRELERKQSRRMTTAKLSLTNPAGEVTVNSALPPPHPTPGPSPSSASTTTTTQPTAGEQICTRTRLRQRRMSAQIKLKALSDHLSAIDRDLVLSSGVLFVDSSSVAASYPITSASSDSRLTLNRSDSSGSRRSSNGGCNVPVVSGAADAGGGSGVMRSNSLKSSVQKLAHRTFARAGWYRSKKASQSDTTSPPPAPPPPPPPATIPVDKQDKEVTSAGCDVNNTPDVIDLSHRLRRACSARDVLVVGKSGGGGGGVGTEGVILPPSPFKASPCPSTSSSTTHRSLSSVSSEGGESGGGGGGGGGRRHSSTCSVHSVHDNVPATRSRSPTRLHQQRTDPAALAHIESGISPGKATRSQGSPRGKLPAVRDLPGESYPQSGISPGKATRSQGSPWGKLPAVRDLPGESYPQSGISLGKATRSQGSPRGKLPAVRDLPGESYPQALCDVEVHISRHWNGGFQGNACIPITEDLTSWTMHLVFDEPVDRLEVWSADIKDTSSDKTTYVLTNKPWNALEHPGDTVCIDFLGHGTGDISPHVTASMEELPGGGAPVPSGEGMAGTLSVKQDWGERFEGEFNFPVKENIEGWMADIVFSKPVTKMDIFVGDAISHTPDGLSWLVVNKQDRPFYHSGDTLSVHFFGNYNGGGGAPTATATLYNMGLDKNWTVVSPPNKMQSKYNYDDALMKSIMFYEAQRSGKLPENNRIPWRGDSALGDRGDNGEDLTGGWYDAGDHVKFNFPMAYTTVVLNWGLLNFRKAYEDSGQLDRMYECVEWPLRYLLKCHVSEDQLYVQVGDGSKDHSYWGRPEDMTMPRPAYKVDPSKPGCDVAMETAAAFASGAMVFNETDPSFSAELLSHAKTLWQFAVDHKGKYSDSVPEAAGFYPSFNYTDELCWGSAWLYRATGEEQYLTEARKWFDPAPDWGMSWDDKNVGCQLLLFEATGEQQYKQAVEDTFQYWFPGGSIQYTPQGLAWRSQWASLRYASNMALAALIAAKDGISPESYRHWAMCQIHYALGDTGFSYEVGFGSQGWALHPHHRGASCPLPPAPCGPQIMSSEEPNVHTLYGALVGGPDASDGYKDQRSNYVSNEVACDYNAGFQSALAGLRALLMDGDHPEQTGDATCPYSSS
ncbi:uncharacterized protein LOC143287772 [Babylonia areolata]|uniref:uncharacterized protein LOC143287772 n=1 Tax=Babylonia areolata TaxID=304850 RepID=UPI003FD6227F